MEESRKGKHTTQETGSRFKLRRCHPEGCELKKLLSPLKQKAAVLYVMEIYSIPERRACRTLAIPRTTYRYVPVKREDEDMIRETILQIVTNFGCVGYRMVMDHLRNQGLCINYKLVYRIWREEGLKILQKQSKKRRLWLDDGSCIRLRADHKNHAWSYDFVEDKTHDGRKIRFLNIMDEYTREC